MSYFNAIQTSVTRKHTPLTNLGVSSCSSCLRGDDPNRAPPKIPLAPTSPKVPEFHWTSILISLYFQLMKTAKLFMNGQSQAVRLPKEFRFGGDSVFIQHLGGCVVLLRCVG